MSLRGALLERLRPLVVDTRVAREAALCQSTTSRIPLTLLQQASLDAFARNEAPGTITVVREGTVDGPIVGTGFYDPSSVAVEVFDWAGRDGILADTLPGDDAMAAEVADIKAALVAEEVAKAPTSSSTAISTLPPIPDVRFFHHKLVKAFRKRTHTTPLPMGNARRLFNGAADGIPSLYIDQYGSHANVYITSNAATQLLPLVEILLLRVFELKRVYHFTPDRIYFGVREGVNRSVAAFDDTFWEEGTLYNSPTEQLNPRLANIDDVLRSTFSYAFHPLQHASAREWVRRNSANKNVVLLGDEVANVGTALNAVMGARKVYYSHEWERSAKRFKAQFTANYNATVMASRTELVSTGELNFGLAREIQPHMVVVSGVGLDKKFKSDVMFAIEFLLAGGGGSIDPANPSLKGHVVIMCGSNSLGLPRLTAGGLIKSAEETVADTLTDISTKFQSKKSSVRLVETERFTSSRGFPHKLSTPASGTFEGWGSAFCDLMIEVHA